MRNENRNEVQHKKIIGCSKVFSKIDSHRDTGLPQKNKQKIPNKQSNFILKTPRNRRTSAV